MQRGGSCCWYLFRLGDAFGVQYTGQDPDVEFPVDLEGIPSYLECTNVKDKELMEIVEALHRNLFKQDISIPGPTTLGADNELFSDKLVPGPLRPLRDRGNTPLSLRFEQQVRSAISTLRVLPSFSSDPEKGRLLDLRLGATERILKQISEYTVSREQRELIDSLREIYRDKRLARQGF